MKISPEQFIINYKNLKFKKKIFLISGNEDSLIKKIQQILILELGEQDPKQIKKITNEKLDGTSLSETGDLFVDNYRVINHINPIDVSLSDLEQFSNNKVSIVISSDSLKNSSKLKKLFDTHEEFVSISCYKLNKETKKKILDYFLNKASYSISQDCYWFLLENSSEYYQIFENEIIKIFQFPEKEISVEKIRRLLSRNISEDVDSLFFLILSKPSNIILHTQRFIGSSADSFVLLQRVKFFFDIIFQSKNASEAAQIFPRYLFKQKAPFLEIFNKITPNNKINILRLIKKTDLLLKKHSGFHMAISQRFLINLRKNLF